MVFALASPLTSHSHPDSAAPNALHGAIGLIANRQQASDRTKQARSGLGVLPRVSVLVPLKAEDWTRVLLAIAGADRPDLRSQLEAGMV